MLSVSALLAASAQAHVVGLATARPARPTAVRMVAAAPTPSAAAGSKDPPADKWNEVVREQWRRAYLTASEAEYEIGDIEGMLPRTLRGTLFRNGPGNFERGGKRYAHILDGDGLLCRFTIDGPTGRARFTSRFVRTPEFEAEREADKILFRNTFGTQPEGLWANFGRMAVKNVANTNVKMWGGRVYALWEAGLPCRVDPVTLDFKECESFGGALVDGFAAVTTGVAAVDRMLGTGQVKRIYIYIYIYTYIYIYILLYIYIFILYIYIYIFIYIFKY